MENHLTLINDNWYFKRTDLKDSHAEALDITAADTGFSGFEPIDLPHDWLIADAARFYEDGIGWYRRILKEGTDFPAMEEGKGVLIRFDGVYMDSVLYINGREAGQWKYGYSTFEFNISTFLMQGENELLLKVTYQNPNSRWYSGAGIYRNVWLRILPQNYIPCDGIYAAARMEEDGGAFYGETEIAGPQAGDCEVKYSLWKDGRLVKELGPQERGISCVEPWSLERPVCYRLRAELWREGAREDSMETVIGFRTVDFDADKGLFLNGRHVKLHGTCEHHDLGCLGAAFNKEAARRRLGILKEMGVNAVRTSHNMPAPEFMELTDEMGILVMSEAFDVWEQKKNEYDYARFFEEWSSRDVKSWVRRDRNHPSLILWSIGNEIYDVHAGPRGQVLTKYLAGLVRDQDPRENGRVTMASNYMPWENAGKCADIIKLAGYNYSEKWYGEHHKSHPDWIIYGSETGSIAQSRGVYHFPASEPLLADEDEQCSSLGNSMTSWGTKNMEKMLADDRDTEFSLGQFLWSGFDYIGEPTPYHTKNSYLGQIDTAGFPKDSYYLLQAEWRSFAEYPMIHVFPYWNFNEGQLVDVRVCTNAPETELFLNGKSLGSRTLHHEDGVERMGRWQVPYEEGYIEAVGYDSEGKPVVRERRHSFGDGRTLRIELNKTELTADGIDMAYADITVLDEFGYPVENAMNYVEASVMGAGQLMGLDNGDSSDYDSYKGTVRKLFNGHLLAVIGSLTVPGLVCLTVRGSGLLEASVTLESRCVEGLTEESQDSTRKGSRIFPCCSPERNPYRNEMVPKPVRQIRLHLEKGSRMSPEQPFLTARAELFPRDASDQEVIWEIVNDRGIKVEYASVLTEGEAGREGKNVTLISRGDGNFRLRCMSKSGTGKVKIISSAEISACGFGQAYLNPYSFVSAGLYSKTVGEIGNGNEKGIATARGEVSGVCYENVEFSDIGSDTVCLQIFALSGEPYEIEIWKGIFGEKGSRLLSTVIYQKPMKWNVYQEETYCLPERLKGIQSISFLTKNKIHLKGFRFKKYERAFEALFAAEADQICGDSFRREGRRITGIGNNVTLEYRDMDFGENGTDRIVICGHTKRPVNTIHIRFSKSDGTSQDQIAEFIRSREERQTFSLDKVCGVCSVSFLFLPGSEFDFTGFQFC